MRYLKREGKFMSVFEDFKEEVLGALNQKMEEHKAVSFSIDARIKMEEVVFAIKLVEEANLRKGYKLSVKEKLESRLEEARNENMEEPSRVNQYRIKDIEEIKEICDKCWSMVNDCCYGCRYEDEDGMCISVYGCVRALAEEIE